MTPPRMRPTRLGLVAQGGVFWRGYMDADPHRVCLAPTGAELEAAGLQPLDGTPRPGTVWVIALRTSGLGTLLFLDATASVWVLAGTP